MLAGPTLVYLLSNDAQDGVEAREVSILTKLLCVPKNGTLCAFRRLLVSIHNVACNLRTQEE